jgi:DAK2 domain fusion protein YloV
VTQSVVWDGADLLNAFATATRLLVEQRGAIDALNVYPVPDGDTGTNMSLTMEAALNEARASSGPNPSVGVVAQRIAHGSLLGARGNSGVILSQIYRGFAQGVAGLDKVDGRDVAHALRCASDTAYKAVMQPVEGTMLTVIRIAAEHAEQTAHRDPSPVPVLESALAAAREALANTPNLLEKLRQAGVVDSGGQGVVFVLQGLLAAATGERPETGAIAAAVPLVQPSPDELDAFGYCTNFMITGQDIPFEQVRNGLAAMGQSAVIVGDDMHVKVHIHTENPGQALDYAIRFGALGQVKIDNMDAQISDRTARPAEPVSTARTGIDVLAVASGAGIADAFRSVGVAGVIDGGQTMNPSVEQLVRAVNSAASNDVILLPNNSNLLMAAQHVPELTGKTIRVVPTRTIAQGLAAAAAFRAGRPLDEVISAMERAMRRIHSVEVSRADKDASVNGLRVSRGQFIGIVDDHLDVASDDLLETATRSLNRAVSPDSELITIFTGDAVDTETPNRLVQWVTERHQDVEVELVEGGQPWYQFVIAVE